MTKHTDSSSESYSLTRDQLISILKGATTEVFDNEVKYVRASFEPPFPEHECRKMKLPQLKCEVNIRGLMVVGTGKGGATKKIDYINALLGKQKPRKLVRTLD